MLTTTLASIALLPGLLTPTVADVKQDTKLAILAPTTLTAAKKGEFYGSGEGGARLYQIRVSTEKDCTGAPCALATFSGSRDGTVHGKRKATLAKGRKGRYTPLTCGASCSPPSIVWKEGGIVYEITMNATRAQLVRMANSAIKKGPR